MCCWHPAHGGLCDTRHKISVVSSVLFSFLMVGKHRLQTECSPPDLLAFPQGNQQQLKWEGTISSSKRGQLVKEDPFSAFPDARPTTSSRLMQFAASDIAGCSRSEKVSEKFAWWLEHQSHTQVFMFYYTPQDRYLVRLVTWGVPSNLRKKIFPLKFERPLSKEACSTRKK